MKDPETGGEKAAATEGCVTATFSTARSITVTGDEQVWKYNEGFLFFLIVEIDAFVTKVNMQFPQLVTLLSTLL